MGAASHKLYSKDKVTENKRMTKTADTIAMAKNPVFITKLLRKAVWFLWKLKRFFVRLRIHQSLSQMLLEDNNEVEIDESNLTAGGWSSPSAFSEREDDIEESRRSCLSFREHNKR
ncbi:hypothetical protein Hdeb2414_s0003g00101921 [Helianthus debilis subsp. tardiflorus]